MTTSATPPPTPPPIADAGSVLSDCSDFEVIAEEDRTVEGFCV